MASLVTAPVVAVPVPAPLATPPLLADGLAVDHPRRPPLAPDAWSKHPLVRLAAFVGLAAIFFLILYFPSALMPREQLVRWAAPLQALTLTIPTVLAYWLVSRFMEGRRRLAELAWSRWTGWLAGAALGFVLCSVVVGVVWVLGGIRFSGTHFPADWAVLVWIAGVQAGIAEEIVFRGLVFRHMEEWLGTWGALAVSALGFGTAHLGNPGATVLSAICIAVEAGLLFGALFALTRSLWVVMGLHSAWNVTQGLLFGVPVSGGTTVGWLQSSPAGSDLVSGGRFGIEASLVTPVLLGALAVWLIGVLVRRRLVIQPSWVRRRRAAAEVEASPAA